MYLLDLDLSYRRSCALCLWSHGPHRGIPSICHTSTTRCARGSSKMDESMENLTIENMRPDIQEVDKIANLFV